MNNEPYYLRVEREAVEILQAHLAKPMPENYHDIGNVEKFDPWEIFPSFYGSYSSEFDELAIGVLEDIRDRVFCHRGLADEMFREYLCRSNLCSYGTSPRGCFPSEKFKPLLPELIYRWKAYSKLQWESEE